MSTTEHSALFRLLARTTNQPRATRLMQTLAVDPALLEPAQDISRAVLAQAMNMLLFEDLMARVPDAAAYVRDRLNADEQVVHDHGAVRTVDGPASGDLPRGQLALTRILEPLGYVQVGEYPLTRLKMTGRSYAHADLPEVIGQFFVSELHVDRFSDEFQAAVARVTASSRDPLDNTADRLLAELAETGRLSMDDAVTLLPALVACFDRQHAIPALADYDVLKQESAEMAWIATEGNAFNHATDRVADVAAVADRERALGRPMKDKVEVSGSGRVRQTAYKAALVERPFRDAEGTLVLRTVPGSFYEFITRDTFVGEDGVERLDLGFDSGNAQGIFKMTAAQAA